MTGIASFISEAISDAEKQAEIASGRLERKIESYWHGRLDALLSVEDYIANQENDIES